MNLTEVTYLLQNPEAITPENTTALKAFVEEYPYFQASRALQLKGLFHQDSFHYNKSLKKTAAFTTDRSILFDFINSDIFHQNKTSQKIAKNRANIGLNNIPVIAEEVRALKDVFKEDDYKAAESVLDPEIFQPKTVENKTEVAPEKTLNIGKPLDFNNERHSFSEWLQLSKFQPIERTSISETNKNQEETSNNTNDQDESTETNRSSRFDLIDKFLEKSPKIVPSKEIINNKNLAKDATSEKNQLMTETLAKVYLEQKKYKKAIQAYQILILKYPEKSSLFADQIKAIKKLQQNN